MLHTFIFHDSPIFCQLKNVDVDECNNRETASFFNFIREILAQTPTVLSFIAACNVHQGMQLDSMKGDLLSVDYESSEEGEEQQEEEEEEEEERVMVSGTSKMR